MGRVIVCIRGRCSTWGKSWKYHMWTAKEVIDGDGSPDRIVTHKSDSCFRCGMSREEAKND